MVRSLKTASICNSEYKVDPAWSKYARPNITKIKPKWHHVILIKFLSFTFNSSASTLIKLNSFPFTFLNNQTKSKYFNQAKFIISRYQKRYEKHKSNPFLTSFYVFFGNVNKSSWAKDWKFKIVHLILFYFL